MEKTDEQLASLIEKLQEAGFAQAPEVIDGALRAIYLDGAVQLVVASVLVALLVGSIVLIILGVVKDNKDVSVFGMVCSPLLFVLAAAVGTISNPWAKVFDPEAVFYYDLMKGIL